MVEHWTMLNIVISLQFYYSTLPLRHLCAPSRCVYYLLAIRCSGLLLAATRNPLLFQSHMDGFLLCWTQRMCVAVKEEDKNKDEPWRRTKKKNKENSSLAERQWFWIFGMHHFVGIFGIHWDVMRAVSEAALKHPLMIMTMNVYNTVKTLFPAMNL